MKRGNTPRPCGERMLVAIMSDIHGNLEALEAVLTDMAPWPVEQVVSIGDMIG